MRIRKGSVALVTLVDGSAFQGIVVRTSWLLRGIRLSDAAATSSRGLSKVDGTLLIPRRSVLLVQVLG